MTELKSHIFVRNPDRKKTTCWTCDARKEDHQYSIHHMVEIPELKSRKKSNARSVRSKTAAMRAVR